MTTSLKSSTEAQTVTTTAAGYSAKVSQGDDDVSVLCQKMEKLEVGPLHGVALAARRVSVIDFTYIILLRLMVAIFTRLFFRPQLAPSTLQTLGQRKRAQELEAMKKLLQDKKITQDFCSITGQYVNQVISPIIASKLSVVPGAIENWVHYKVGTALPYGVGYGVRYANYQVNNRTGYRAAFIESAAGKAVGNFYSGLSTRLSYLLTNQSVLDMWINFQHTLLRLCMKADKEVSAPDTSGNKRLQIVLGSLALSFSQQAEIDDYIKSLKVESPEDALIAGLEWRRVRKTLPPGVPDPGKEQLTRETIRYRLDEELYKYVSGLIEKVLKRFAPESLTRGLMGVAYWLEGEKILNEIITTIGVKFGIDQLVDPYLLTLAVLNSQGVETYELEPDGFGPNTSEKIAKTGQEMILESLRETPTAQAILTHFEKSGLNACPGNVKRILMRSEAKARLKRYISELIYSYKEADSQNQTGAFKTARERASQLPFVGFAVLSLHALVNGSLFTWNYLFRKDDAENKTFLQWMVDHFIGHNFCDFLAGRIVDLIYHPSWRFTLLHLIDTLVKSFTDPEPALSVPSVDETKENFKKITAFLFDAILHDTSSLFNGQIGSWAKHFTGEGAFGVFQQLMKPSSSPFLEKGLASLLPTMKELLLFSRVTEAYRWEFVTFTGDAKFWECYVREYLNRELARINPAVSERLAVREDLVDKLLALSPQELRKQLSKISPHVSASDTIPIDFVVVPRPPKSSN